MRGIVTTVSYTHLDVYKRQDQMFRINVTRRNTRWSIRWRLRWGKRNWRRVITKRYENKEQCGKELTKIHRWRQRVLNLYWILVISTGINIGNKANVTEIRYLREFCIICALLCTGQRERTARCNQQHIYVFSGRLYLFNTWS